MGFLYLVSSGAQKVDGALINVGDTLPAVSARAENGEEFDCASLAGSGRVLKSFCEHW